MPRLCNSLAHRAKSHIPMTRFIFAITLIALISFSAMAFAQDSFMIGVSPMTLGGIFVQRGDFNNDGIPDILVMVFGSSSTPAVSVFLGKGDGTFQPSLGSGTGISAGSMAVCDFNGDGKLDVAVGGYDSALNEAVIPILLGHGDGTFSTGQTIALSSSPNSITTGDFNGDGKLDIAFAADKVYFYQGGGNGTFTANTSVKVGTQPTLYQVVVGD